MSAQARMPATSGPHATAERSIAPWKQMEGTHEVGGEPFLPRKAIERDDWCDRSETAGKAYIYSPNAVSPEGQAGLVDRPASRS